MNTDLEEFIRNLEQAKTSYKDAKKFYKKLKSECPHQIVSSLPNSKWNAWDYGHAYCAICSENFGYYCPTSPTKSCQYDEGDVCRDCCVYCGLPWERK